MRGQHINISILLAFIAFAGCSLTNRETEPSAKAIMYSGQFSPRSGTPHPGAPRLALTAQGLEIAGDFTLEGDLCAPVGALYGTLEYGRLKAFVKGLKSTVDLDLSCEGQDFFGTYRFTSGECAGDWGSALFRKAAKP